MSYFGRVGAHAHFFLSPTCRAMQALISDFLLRANSVRQQPWAAVSARTRRQRVASASALLKAVLGADVLLAVHGETATVSLTDSAAEDEAVQLLRRFRKHTGGQWEGGRQGEGAGARGTGRWVLDGWWGGVAL